MGEENEEEDHEEGRNDDKGGYENEENVGRE